MLLTLLAAASMMPGSPSLAVQHGHKRVAVLPWVYRGGTETAIRTAQDTIDQFFDRAGYDRLSTNTVASGWGRRGVELVGPEQDPIPRLPSDASLRRLGRELGVDLVCAGEVYWHTRPIWVALGPKTKSTCTVNMKLVDMDHRGVVLSERNITADDTAEESGLQTAAGILSAGLVTAVSGGPETPHQQRAAQIALSEAFGPWLEGAIGR